MTLLVLLLAVFSNGMAAQFDITDIRIEGLQRITAGTVFNYLPVKPGDVVEPSVTPKIVRALYKTGFFKDVRLERDQNVLVISVVERPAIYEINFTGNKSLEEEQLKQGLKDAGLSEGRTFNRSVLDRIEQELKRLFFARGKYAVKLTSTVTPLERNRVAIDIEILEGETALVKKINVVGNSIYDDETLLGLFDMTTGGWFSSFTKDNQYSRQKLAGDLEKLRSFYLNRGYIKFKIDSTQVSISPEKKGIYVTINITEGDIYTISDMHLAGKLEGDESEYFPLIHLRRGEPYKRRDVVDSNDRLSQLLSEKGFAFANVNNIPEVNDEDKTVDITFFVDPGKRVYVRRVNIKGNSSTRDEVIRREFRQMESAWFSSEKVKLSKQRANRTGYFSSVSITTPSVPGSNDEVDVDVTVVEKPSGAILAGLGYSQSGGVAFNTSISQDNFLGTGKKVSASFKTSDASEHYQIGYGDPYYTVDGISRDLDLSYKSTDFSELDSADYKTDDLVASVKFGLPLNEENRVNAGLAFHAINFTAGSTASTEVTNFVTKNGNDYYNFELTSSWRHDSRNSALFPINGTVQSLSSELTVPGSSLTYFKINYNHREYWEIAKDTAFSLNTSLGYGTSYGDTNELPFFENYFAGGQRSIRGYKSLSIGPRDSTGDPLGANTKIVGNAELLLPAPGGSKTMRFAAFVDMGMVYDADVDAFDADELRYSTGLGFSWLSPVGPLTFSYAVPLKTDSQDQEEAFQFSLGSTF